MKVMTFEESKTSGYDIKAYSGDPLPEGSWIGILEFRMWGKDDKCIHCYFTDQDGDKRRLTAFPIERGSMAGNPAAFGPKDGSVNFAEDNIEDITFGLVTGKNGKGKPAWHSATNTSHSENVLDILDMAA